MSKEINDKLDLAKTEEIFDSLIKRSDIHNTAKDLDGAELQKVKAVVAGGNLHVKTAQIKIAAIRLAGFRDGIRDTKLAVQRRVRNARKYGK